MDPKVTAVCIKISCKHPYKSKVPAVKSLEYLETPGVHETPGVLSPGVLSPGVPTQACQKESQRLLPVVLGTGRKSQVSHNTGGNFFTFCHLKKKQFVNTKYKLYKILLETKLQKEHYKGLPHDPPGGHVPEWLPHSCWHKLDYHVHGHGSGLVGLVRCVL